MHRPARPQKDNSIWIRTGATPPGQVEREGVA